MRVLVTGASGFLGLNVLDALAARGCPAIGLARALPASTVDPDHEFVPGDVRDRGFVKQVFRDYRPSHVIHAAAVTPSNDLERENPRLIVETNELSTLTVIQAAAEHHVRRVVFVSSAAVYAKPHNGTQTLVEDAPLNDEGHLYALTKIASERLCRWATAQYGLDTRSVRVGPVYGPHERPTSSRQRMSVVCRAVGAARRGEPLRCDAAGAVYDWIYGADAAGALVEVLTAVDLQSDCFNLAGPNIPMSRLLAAIAQAIPGTAIEWVHTAEANLPIPSAFRRTPLDATRIGEETGYRPAHTIETGVAAYVRWLDG